MIDTNKALEMYRNMYSLRAIANTLGCAKNTVKYHLLKNNIILRPNNFIKVNYDKENEIIKLYLSGKSLNELARFNSCSVKRIKNILVKNNINIRNCKEATRKYHYKDIPIPDHLMEIIEGELLGDGHITSTQNQAFFQYNTSNKEYCKWLQKCFIDNNIKTSKIYLIDNGIGLNGKLESFHFKTVSTKQFRDVRKKWYTNIKIVPRDLKLTSTNVRHWWIGDGCFSARTFATNGFSKEDVWFLVQKLSAIGISCNRHNNNTIYISVKSIDHLIEFIGKCPVKSYKYKWGQV